MAFKISLIALLFTIFIACTPPVTPPKVDQVVVNASITTVSSGSQVTLQAVVNGSGDFDSGVNWTTSAGSLSSLTGASVTLTTPTVTETTQVKIVASSAADSTKSSTLFISVSPAISVVETVTLSSPSLQLATGSTLQMTLVAKDKNGVTLGDKPTSWLSFDPSIIEVNATGLVTAKRFGTADIQAIVEGKAATLRLSTFGLEAAGGVAAFAESTTTLKGTSLFFNLKTSTGSLPTAPSEIRVEGPIGWNNGKPLTQKIDFSLPWAWSVQRDIAPVSGSYTASMLIAGVMTRFAFTVDGTSTVMSLKSPLLQNTVRSGSADLSPYLDFRWINETSSKSFRVRVLDQTTGMEIYKKTVTNPQQGLMSQFATVSLNQAHQYRFEVIGLNVSVSDTSPVTPTSFHVSAASRPIPQFPLKDMTFGLQGETNITFVPTVLVALPNGKVIAAGSAENGILGSTDFALTRLNSDGSVDQTFGTNGYTHTNFSVSYNTYGKDVLTRIAIAPDGKILALGETGDYGMQNVMARYSADGILDTSFATLGRLTVVAPFTDRSFSSALAVTSDGFIVGGNYKPTGAFYVQPMIKKYTNDGTPDSMFGVGGEVSLATTVTDTSGGVNNIQTTPDGKLLLTGYFTPYMFNGGAHSSFVARLQANGNLDASFGQQGVKTLNFSTTFEELRLIERLPDGKLLAAGYITIGENYLSDYFIVRFLDNGELDTSFGKNGYMTIDSGGQYDDTKAMVFSDGKIWLLGTTGIAVVSSQGENLGTVTVLRNSGQIIIRTAVLTTSGLLLIPLESFVDSFKQGIVGGFRPN